MNRAAGDPSRPPQRGASTGHAHTRAEIWISRMIVVGALAMGLGLASIRLRPSFSTWANGVVAGGFVLLVVGVTVGLFHAQLRIEILMAAFGLLGVGFGWRLIQDTVLQGDYVGLVSWGPVPVPLAVVGLVALGLGGVFAIGGLLVVLWGAFGR